MTKDVKFLAEAYAASIVRSNVSANNSGRQVGNIPDGAISATNWGEDAEGDLKRQITSKLKNMLNNATIGSKEAYNNIFFDIKNLQQLLNQVIN